MKCSTHALVLCGAVTGTLVAGQIAVAQMPDRPAEAAVQVGGAAAGTNLPYLQTLAQALGALPWDVARHGALLAVDPQKVRAVAAGSGLPPQAEGSTLRQTAQRFGRKVVALGTLSVLAPTEMVLLNTRPGKPDPLAGLGRNERLLLLQASLSASQWRLMGSAQGLGLSDLNPQQQGVFRSLLPEPLRIQRQRVENGVVKIQDNGKRITVSPNEREGVRLRLRRSTSMSLPRGSGSVDITTFTGRLRTEGSEFSTLGMDLLPVSLASDYGRELRRSVPNRLKPTHLPSDLPALGARVSLEGPPVTSGAAGAPLTVGELVQRVGAATRLELHADPRMAALPVWTCGASARAGDVLEALCWAVTGTFRKVGPAFVLTDDLAGLGARRALLDEWAEEAQAQQQETLRSLQAAAALQQPGQHLAFSPDDPLALSPELMGKIEEHWAKDATGSRYPVPVAALSPEQQAYVRRWADWWAARDPSVRSDQVYLDVNLDLSYVVPNVGEVEIPLANFASLESLMPRQAAVARTDAPLAPLPAAVGNLYVAPASAEEAGRAVLAAQKRGIKQLWVGVPLAGGRQILEAAIRAGKQRGLPVYAVVRLLRDAHLAQRDTPEAFLDVNIQGETSAAYSARLLKRPAAQRSAVVKRIYAELTGWQRVDVPGHRARLERHLVELATTPGLAGLVLRDTAAPGYLDSGNPIYSFGKEATAFGYTPQMRLAFLRQEGVDPVDFVIPGGSHRMAMATRLPFFPEATVAGEEWTAAVLAGQVMQGRTVPREGMTGGGPTVAGANEQAAYRKWSTFRSQENRTFLTNLFAALRGARPDLALFVGDRSQISFDPAHGWYGSWDKADALPAPKPGPAPATQASGSAASSLTLRSFRYLPGFAQEMPKGAATDRSPQSPAEDARHPNTPKSRAGSVLDLSEVPMGRAIELLERMAPSQRANKQVPRTGPHMGVDQGAR